MLAFSPGLDMFLMLSVERLQVVVLLYYQLTVM